ncbi:hypothetical protein [Streptomyces beihaiensis]|uniref:Uncharacterized protein n=1 Tax=Streptomyces beihaiensis TaxID=2984495 RepID=A0ABT3TU46_9ACTN|nr:hypothetical protein [Streptomyces beihaiensis]MCX3060551.1 hypothetical protein [Streptomyces beihaiensis]
MIRSRRRRGHRPSSGRGRIAALTAIVAVAPGIWLAAPAAQAAAPASDHSTASAHHSADTGPAVRHDTSPTLRAMAARAHAHPHGHHSKRPQDDDPGEDRLPHPPASPVPDPVVQSSPGGPSAPSTGTNFEGIGAGNYSITGVPPDPNAAVGATQIVETVNTAYAVFSKTGSTVLAPTDTNTLWSGFGGNCESTNDGDAVVRWDSLASRWVVTQFANVRSSSGPYYECVAVSTGTDATGSYHRYSFEYANFPDYPKLSVWPDAYYVTYNMFTASGSFLHGEACAMDRANMLTGGSATQQCFTTSSSYGGLLGADLDGSTAPPSGEPELMMSLGTTSSSLAYWKFHTDWNTPSNSTFSGPTTLSVAPYTTACGSSGTCVPQSGTSQQLDSLSDRLMYRFAYRNFGDHESLVVDHAVTAGSSVGVRWYEMRLSGGNPTVYQQGTYAPDSTYRWMGSIAEDTAGNIALGYSDSSSSAHPSIRYTGRLAGDTLGTMTQGEVTAITGGGSQTSYSRWGDYTSMSVDPSDGCTFWYTNEYIPSNGNFNWHTRLASFTLPNCGSTATDDFSVAVDPASGSVAAGSSASTTVSTTVTSGSSQTVDLSASGLPSGATASFSPASVTAGNSSTLKVATSSSTPAGTYDITVTAKGSSATHTATYTLTVNSTGTGGAITNPGFEQGSLTGWTPSGTTSVVGSGVHSGSYAAQVGGTSPTNGDSSIAQSFTAPAGTSTLGFYYSVTCPDSIWYDWATATLKDNTTGTTTTVLAKTCPSSAAWSHSTASVTAGHSYTLTLISHDDGWPGDATYTHYDDVTLS